MAGSARPRRDPSDEAPKPIPGPVDTAYVILTLDRATGRVDIDETFSTPAETWTMLSRAFDDVDEHMGVPHDDA